MSKLRKLQHDFARLVPRLLDKAHSLGYEITLGDVYRDPRSHGELGVFKSYGHPRSAHKQRLAIDINLFKNGVYLDTTADHKVLGDWWKKQHPQARAGSDFGDGNHYSLEFEGVK
jgi:hypothetical protein